MRSLLLTLLSTLFVITAWSQDTKDLKLKKSLYLDAKLPIDPDIRKGVLPNGLTYIVKKNSKPENRAELRLVVNAGSILEKENQQGLAHFVEHMAFNGTKNFKKSELVDYLEGIGVKFGPHLNAYTSFDETVYMIQLPTDDKGILDKGFQILEDWAGAISFEEEEIDKERGVVVEEWRLGRGAGARMRDKYFPVLFQNSQYAKRLPIGKKEVIEGAAYETVREFYNDWYTPDLMCVIAVGDIDVEATEARIKSQFGKLPEGNSQRGMFDVPDHKETLVSIATDKEATSNVVQLIYKHDPVDELLVKDYRTSLTHQLYAGMINDRLRELRMQAEPPFLYGYSYYGSVVRQKDGYISVAGTKQGGILEGLRAVATENERVKRYGFTEGELERAKMDIMTSYERSYNEREKTESRQLAAEYVRHFLEKEPAPGISYEYELVKAHLPGIKLEEVNALVKKWITKENLAVVVMAPDKEGVSVPTEKELLAVLKEMQTKQLEPYEDNVSDEPLISDLAEPGTITANNDVVSLGAKEVKLSNGVRVITKHTQFKKDQIMLYAFSNGGHGRYPTENYLSAAYATSIINESGVGDFDEITLQKKLAGKSAWVSPYISELREGMRGGCRPDDLETMMQLIHLYFTSPRKDKTAYQAFKARQQGQLENRGANPNAVFSDSVRVTLANYHPRRRPITMDRINEIELAKALEVYVDRFSDASDFTFVIVGNFDQNKMNPLLQKYVANLPVNKRNDNWVDTGVEKPEGKIEKTIKRGIEPKARVQMYYHGKFDWNYQERFEMNAMLKVLRIKLRESMREDMGGVYGVGARGSQRKVPREDYTITLSWGCAPSAVQDLIVAAKKEIATLQANGPTDQDLEKVKNGLLREHETNLEKNNWWLNTINSIYMNDEEPTRVMEYTKIVEALDGKAIQASAKKYFNDDSYIQMVLMPE